MPRTFYVATHPHTYDWAGRTIIDYSSHDRADQIPDNALSAWQVDNVVTSSDAIAAVLAASADVYTYGATVTRIKPTPPTAEQQEDNARRILRAAYWSDVRDIVNNLRDEIQAGNITDTDAATEWLDETVDSHQRVIYTHLVFDTLMWSDNDSAYVDEFGEAPVEDDNINWPALAYFALRADVLTIIRDMDDFIDEHKPQPYAECDECGDEIMTQDETAESHVGTAIEYLCKPCHEDRELNDDADAD